MRSLLTVTTLASLLYTTSAATVNPKSSSTSGLAKSKIAVVKSDVAETAHTELTENANEQSTETPYMFHPKIHNLGNIGLGGGFHAFVAPLATHMIDRLAYGGADARKLVHSTMSSDLSVIDLCCGVGFSSKKGALGVDTSPQMVAMARMRRPDCKFALGNAEDFGEDACTDVATVMFGFHEMPQEARRSVLKNAARIARKQIIVVDIDPGFTPSDTMLSGEPYVLEYLRNVDEDIQWIADLRAWRSMRVEVVPGHVIMWRLDL